MASNVNDGGLTSQERARFARKLVGADLDAERAKAQALAKEARMEGGGKAAKLSAIAQDRLALIAKETDEREKLAEGADPKLAARRETAQRTAAVEAKSAQREAARLDAVKQAYADQLAGGSARELGLEQKLEAVRLDAAQAGVKAAKNALAAADTAPEKQRAKSALKLAEQAVRTEYARNAVIHHEKPATYNHQAMHDYADAQKGKAVGDLQAERQKVHDAFRAMTTGGIRGSRVEVATQKVKLAILDQAIAKAEGKPLAPPAAPTTGVTGPKDKLPSAGAPVFKEPGVFVANSDAFPSDIAIQKMKAAGVKWCALQIANGSTVDEETQVHLQRDFVKRCHDAGLQVGFWGYLQTDPVSDAKTVSKQIKDYGADFYVANPELEYKYTSANGSPAPEAYGRSQKFVEAFRAELPDLPAAVTSYGRYDKADLDWKAWQQAGFEAIPECFLNEQPDWDPKSCVEGAEKVGWPKDQIHPMFGLWGGGQRGLISADAYADNMRQSGAKGFSSYLAEQMSDEDWAGLKRAIDAGDLAD